MQKIELFLFVTVFVILNTQGTARPMDSTNDEITFLLPTTIEAGYSITVNGVLDEQSEDITVLLRAEGYDDSKIHYNYETKIMEVTPGVEGVNMAEYKINQTDSTFTLGLTGRMSKFDSPQLNVTFKVNGMSQSLYLDTAETMEHMNSIVLKEGVKKVNSLSFNFV